MDSIKILCDGTYNRGVLMVAEKKYCSPDCDLFRCGKRALNYRRNSVWCRWTEENCNVANCSYAICVKRRLLPNGVCGETVKRKTVDKRPEEELKPEVKLRGKALRKIGKGEEFF